MTNKVFQKFYGQVFVFAGAKRRHLAGIGARCLVLFLDLLTHDHEVVLLQLQGVAWLILLVNQHLLGIFVLGTRHLNLLFEVTLEI